METITRPLVWIEILRREMVYLDQTLGDLIEDELRFLAHCGFLERSLTTAALFNGTAYDRNRSSAHVFGGSLRKLTELCVREEGRGETARLVCMDSREFEGAWDGAGDETIRKEVQNVERLVTDLANPENPHRDFRIARLIALYCASNCLLESFSLPFRKAETLAGSLGWSVSFRRNFGP